MKYREFLSLTDEEIKFILTDIFNPTKIENIQRDKNWNKITADITTNITIDEQDFEITRQAVLSPSAIAVNDYYEYENQLKWRKFLLAKGCDERLKDNPYLEE
jgi:hypothetical protein|nr:MAG TPA: hypothetical protein [Caudoviricetes sp.]